MSEKKELNEKELQKVSGGSKENPKHFNEGDSIYFYFSQHGVWIWGFYVGFHNGWYTVRWNDTTVINGPRNHDPFVIEAGEMSIPEEFIK